MVVSRTASLESSQELAMVVVVVVVVVVGIGSMGRGLDTPQTKTTKK